MKKPSFSQLILWLVLAFLYIPLLILVINSFNGSRFGGTWQGWTVKWYKELFYDKELWKSVKNTLWVASAVTLTTTILGTLAAFSLHLYRSKLQKLHFALLYAPLFIPEVQMGMSLMLLFIFFHLPLGLCTIFIAHVTFCLSYVTLVMLASFEQFDFTLIEAASDLGASTGYIVRKIMLPLLGPGLGASALMAFTLSIDDFVITFFVSGPGSTTLPLHIYSMTKYGTPALINALSSLLILGTLTLGAINQWLKKSSLKAQVRDSSHTASLANST